jgi:NADH dehydrogenase FAD-containing subunit
VEAREATETKKARSQKEADYINNLILRDTLQASSADAIYAIGQIKGNPTSDGVFHKSQVEGGTGWAVQVGINQGKPVYVFDQVRNQWYKNEGTAENRRFVPIQEAPKLTNNFAGIGTEHLNDKGR